ncbi:response regulator transcription factor [Bradyrhizobium sp. WSM 1744]|uniref:Response regulator transcription factor n=1 Tax=Bradyrhizobium archetypum TaxID=2721160 RepID=A0A7Y4M0X3_9BRAD|nr:response regulator transcription factor [Bradyrhizobium archetypum]
MPRRVTISSRIGEGIFLPLTTMKSLAPPRSSRSSVRNPASRRRYQAMLPAGSCTNRSRSSGWLSGQSMVMMNSALQSIRSIVRGEQAISDDIARVLAMESLSPSASVLDQLREREIEILRQLAAGATTEQIAANLNLSMKIVQNYHYLIKTKTGMRTDAQLVRLAVECGLASL